FDVADDDTPGVVVDPPSPHAVAEGGATSTYSIRLASEPTADVTIAPQAGGQLTWSVASITFTAADWNVPQNVTLVAVDDQVDEPEPHPGTLVHDVTSADAAYQGIPVADVTADIGDNDTSDLVIDPVGGLAVDEAGLVPAATYTVTLTSEPTDP